MMQYGPLVYQLGLIDELEFAQINSDANTCVLAIESGEYNRAWDAWDDILSLISTFSGCGNPYNILNCTDVNTNDFAVLFQNPAVRLAIHVGNLSFGGGI